MRQLQAPISYQGSKRKETHLIKQFEPKGADASQPPYKTIIDAYGGGGSVSLYYLQNNEHKANIIYNDLSQDMARLFITLKDQDETKKFIQELIHIPISKEEFFEAV